MPLLLTDHARVRLQQRGITEPVLECLLTYGSTVHDHRGGELVFFDHHARDRLRRTKGAEVFKKIEPKLDTYAVIVEDGVVLNLDHQPVCSGDSQRVPARLARNIWGWPSGSRVRQWFDDCRFGRRQNGVVEYFAFLHDTCRQTDGRDHE
jgi:hypothetical protein